MNTLADAPPKDLVGFLDFYSGEEGTVPASGRRLASGS